MREVRALRELLVSHAMVRSAAIEALNDAGFADRHIISMLRHRERKSIESYSKKCSTRQKVILSDALQSKICLLHKRDTE